MLIVARPAAEAMQDHARRDFPRECCGVLGGRQGMILRHYELRNEASDPHRRYSAAPSDLFAAMREMRAHGEKLVGIYHSHPCGPSHPSPADIDLSFYPDAVHFIIAQEGSSGDPGVLGAFAIANGAYRKVEFEIVDACRLQEQVMAYGAK